MLRRQIKDETFDFVLGEAKVDNQTATGGQFELDKSKPYYKGTMMITSLDIKSTDVILQLAAHHSPELALWKKVRSLPNT